MRIFIRGAVFATAFVFVLRLTLIQINEFLDPSPPDVVHGKVTMIGVRHQPMPVSYMTLNAGGARGEFRVDVLPSKAARTRVGDDIPLAIGRGLLRKPWSILEEDYRQFDNAPFKILYVGAFTFGIVVLSLVYVRGVTSLPRRTAQNFYLACLFVGTVLFFVL